jgi:hypothetical protein
MREYNSSPDLFFGRGLCRGKIMNSTPVPFSLKEKGRAPKPMLFEKPK